MKFRSDYGAYLQDQGHPQDTLYTFYSVAIDHVSLVDGLLFSTLVDSELAGIQHALAFNFDAEVFGQLVVLAPKLVRAHIHARLRNITQLPRTIEFSIPILCRIEAMLGERQKGRAGEFIPLVIKRMAAADVV
jgi:hypothetical protein